MEYNQTLTVIQQSDFLPENDLEFIRNALPELQANWEKQQRFRTEVEMHISVLNDVKHPTRASKYWQAIREQGVFYSELVRASFEYRKNDIEIAKKSIELEGCTGVLDSKLAQIELEELEYSRINMAATAKDRMRELRLWQEILHDLDDGSFDTIDVNTHQLVSYGQRFVQQEAMMGNSASPSERANLLGQLGTTTRIMKRLGLIDKSGNLLSKEAEHFMKTGEAPSQLKLKAEDK